MARYHINPNTGNAGVCKAKVNCPYGDLEKDHFNTKWEAMRAYEEGRLGETFQTLRKTTEAVLDSVAAPAPRKATNPNLPANAMGTAGLKKGMKFTRAYDPNGTVYTVVEDVDPSSPTGRIKTNKGTLVLGPNWKAGTVRLVNPPAGYNYHHAEPSVSSDGLELARSAVKSYEQLPRPAKALSQLEARRIAAAATSQNSGNTILEAREPEAGVVELKMSSWPRANEAKKAFEARGYMVEFGGNHFGQWLRVQPFPQEGEYVESSKLMWNQENGAFVEEASSLGTGGLPRYLRSSRTGEMVELKEPLPHYDGDGDITHWELHPYNPTSNWKLVVFND